MINTSKKNLAFKASKNLTLGVELELQLINPASYDLTSCAKDLLRNIKDSPYSERITPEMTQSMFEINTSIHQHPATLLAELQAIKKFLLEQAAILNFEIAGGGTHPFQRWSAQSIFPTHRYRNILRSIGYMAKRWTIFGLHVHVGCKNANDALYLSHMLTLYVPHFIALSASSPYHQGADTAFNSSRITIVSSLQHTQVMPYITDWQAFSDYFHRMQRLKIVHSMKDFHWDIRPKPEFGTVEIRVCDAPLTLEQTAAIAAYVQTLAHYLLNNRPALIPEQAYDVYPYNRFQAGRFGFAGDYIDPITEEHHPLKEIILDSMAHIQTSAAELKTQHFIDQLKTEVDTGKNDASWLREVFDKVGTLNEVVRKQCSLWRGDF